jgi:hypothetical protein
MHAVLLNESVTHVLTCGARFYSAGGNGQSARQAVS